MTDVAGRLVKNMEPQSYGRYRIPIHGLLEIHMDPTDVMAALEKACSERAKELGLRIETTYDIDYREIVFSWAPENL